MTTVLAGARPHGPPRRRTAALLAAVAAVVLAIVTGLVVTRGTEGSAPAVDTPAPSPASTTSPDGPRQTLGTLPASTDVVAATPFEDGTVLMWLPYEGLPQYLAQQADRPVPVGIGDPPQPGRGRVVSVNDAAGFLVQGSLFLVDRRGEVTRTGVAGDQVLANRGDGGAFYVLRSRELSRYNLLTGVDGSWTLPDGWQLPTLSSAHEVLDGRLVLERIDEQAAVHEIALWTLGTGELEPIGRARWVVDATVYPHGMPVLAWLDDDCDQESTGCGLVVTNLDTMESRTVVRPEHGYIGGGAFSDDGRHLAVFVAGQANMPVNPSADLAVVDIETLEMRVLAGTNVPVGEPYGSAAWTLDNGSVIYHGLSETRVVDVESGEQRSLPWDITYSMATIP